MNVRTSFPTITFIVLFAVWSTSARYGASGFYDWAIAPGIGNILKLATIAICLAVAASVIWRAFQRTSFPWPELTIFGVAILGCDLVWRYYLSRDNWDAHKITSAAFDIAMPLIAGLGVVAVVLELRSASEASRQKRL